MNLKKSILVILSFVFFGVQAQKSTYNFKKIDSIGTALETSIRNDDVTYFNSVFNLDKLFLKVVSKNDDSELLAIEESFKSGFKEGFSFAKELIANNKIGGSYDYLKFYLSNDKKFHLLFRLISNEGINYHDYQLVNIDNNFEIEDIYIYLSGENISETLKIIYQNLLFEKGVSKSNRRFVESIYIAKDIKKLIAIGEIKKAEKLFKNINKKVRKHKLFQILNITIASSVSDKKYLKALQEYEKLFPNDPCLHLISIDAAIMRKDYKTALYHIDALDKAIDGDPFLDLHRAGVYIYKEDYETSILYSKNVLENFPNELTAYDNLLFCYNTLKKYDLATLIVEEYIDVLTYDETEILGFVKSEYPKLYKSTAYKKWLKARNKTQKEDVQTHN